MMKQLHLFDAELVTTEKPRAAVEQPAVGPRTIDAIQEIRALGEKLAQPEHAGIVQGKEAIASVRKKSCVAHWKLFVDGAARNNPGPAGAGFYLLKDGQESAKKGYYLGSRTNNQAEYCALLLGLHFLKNYVKPGDCVHIISDSQLLVRQLKGEYRIKSPELRPLYTLAHALMRVVHAEIFHVLRADNVQADRMANKGIDTKRAVPEDFVKMLHAHGISW